ncbi:MAG TPA: hypothetical protein VN205_12300 [Thermomonas sp.]|nr:hypothetical protein [Thermomonas sp.]
MKRSLTKLAGRIADLASSLRTGLPDVTGTFVVWEPCSRNHGEVVPGFVHYLRALGYRVSVLISPGRVREGLFSRTDDPGVQVFGLPQRRIRRWIRRGGLRGSLGVMVTTASKLPVREDGRIDYEQVFGAENATPVYVVEHDVRERVDRGVWDPRSITLRAVDYRGARSVVVNPHDFGTVAVTPRSAGPLRFLVVGTLGKGKRAQHRIVDAVRELVGAGERGFEVTVIGKRGVGGLPADVAGMFRVLGRVSFATLYAEVERADVLLTAYEAENADHDFYRTAGTSGNFQLVWGFAKPCVVLREFAAINGLDEDNSILYDGSGGLADGMRRAIALTPAAYARMQGRLQQDAAALADASRRNLAALLATAQGCGSASPSRALAG